MAKPGLCTGNGSGVGSMCDTPLEVKFMLRETEARSRAFVRGVRTEDEALAGFGAKAWAKLGQWLAGQVWAFGKTEKKAS